LGQPRVITEIVDGCFRLVSKKGQNCFFDQRSRVAAVELGLAWYDRDRFGWNRWRN
jgi:hypothetical protein